MLAIVVGARRCEDFCVYAYTWRFPSILLLTVDSKPVEAMRMLDADVEEIFVQVRMKHYESKNHDCQLGPSREVKPGRLWY